MAELPCRNPNCKSHGIPHPNCKCYGRDMAFAEGGQVCSGAHEEGCEYYADGGEIEQNNQFVQNPMAALDHVGAQHGLHHLLTKLGHNGRSENKFKHLEDYKDSLKRGKKRVEEHTSNIMTPKKHKIEHDHEGIQSLKNHLNEIQLNPEKAFDVGGNLGSVFPDHAAALGAKTAQSLNYLESIKPMPNQSGPLDPVMSVSKAKEAQYNRQLAIAQNPMIVMSHVKSGTVLPQDLKTLNNVYPELARSMIEKAGEAVIDAKNKKTAIPFKTRQGLSMLLGQPLDFTQTPQAMQAIMKANGSEQMPQGPQKQPKKATGVELNQINKVDEQLATPDQKRLMGKS
jgi:hypothetical protein